MPQAGPKCLIKVSRAVYERLTRLKRPGLSFNSLISLLLDIAEPLLAATALQAPDAPGPALEELPSRLGVLPYLKALAAGAGVRPSESAGAPGARGA